MNILSAHSANNTSLYGPEVSWQVTEKTIDFKFSVRSSCGFHSCDNFGFDYSKNWGLWDFDVVEIFIKRSGEHYLELQCSPLGQTVALLIEKPREKHVIPKTLPVNFTSNIDTEWKTKISIPLDFIPGDGASIFGGCFACLGENPREYYSLNPNPEKSADFHRPELFLKFGEIK